MASFPEDLCRQVDSCPTVTELIEDSGSYADDATWVLTASFVILTMQTGFGLLEMSCCQVGYEVHIMLKNVMDVVFGALAFYLVGYGIAFGSPSSPFMGLGDFVPDGNESAIDSGLQYSLYLFVFSFAATATTIVSGCVAMRMKFFVYAVFSFFAVIFFCFVAHWVYADDGWLMQMGAHDFAGGGPVHLLGGMNGFVALIMLGPRTGRFDGTRPRSDFKASAPASMLFGLFMLWWGWIGFNCGSSYGITEDRWIVATRAGITTINSSCAGGLAALVYTLATTKGKYVMPEDIVNGILGSLVAITPACACVRSSASLIIGAIGTVVGLLVNVFMERMELDDPVGAVGVHGGAAIWGLISVGLFADGSLPGVDVRDGLFYGGGAYQLGFQMIEILAVTCWAIVVSGIFFYIVGVMISGDLRNPRAGLRVSLEEELQGADAFLHGVKYDDEEDELLNGSASGKVGSSSTTPLEELNDEEEGDVKVVSMQVLEEVSNEDDESKEIVTSRPESMASITARPESTASITARPESTASITARPESKASITFASEKTIDGTDQAEAGADEVTRLRNQMKRVHQSKRQMMMRHKSTLAF